MKEVKIDKVQVFNWADLSIENQEGLEYYKVVQSNEVSVDQYETETIITCERDESHPLVQLLNFIKLRKVIQAFISEDVIFKIFTFENPQEMLEDFKRIEQVEGKKIRFLSNLKKSYALNQQVYLVEAVILDDLAIEDHQEFIKNLV